jgi:hypothetical protein
MSKRQQSQKERFSKNLENNKSVSHRQHLLYFAKSTREVAMPYDEFERLFEKCIHCGMHTIWKIDDIPCAKELEADLDPLSLEQSCGSEA